MELLRRIEDPGYPSDYLFSRIRGKRVRLLSDWEYLISLPDPLEYIVTGRNRPPLSDAAPDGIWQGLTKEFRWVYHGMNGTLRNIFTSFFLYTELRTVFICLRYIKGRERGRIEGLLSQSLLPERLRKILGSAGDLAVIIKETDRIFGSLSERLAGIEKNFHELGLPGVERHVTDRYLEYSMESAPHQVMKDFFGLLIDARNLLALYKYLRLGAKTPPSFIRGGSISEKRFRGTRDSNDVSTMLPLLRTVTGMTMSGPAPAEVENALYRHITRRLRKAGRDPLGVGFILDYLWRCSIEARNLSTLFYGKELDRGSLAEEMIG